MRQDIQRWHVGQLVMAWIGAAGSVALLFIAGMLAFDAMSAARNQERASRILAIETRISSPITIADALIRGWDAGLASDMVDSVLQRAGFNDDLDRPRISANLTKLKAATASKAMILRYVERERNELLSSALLRAERAPIRAVLLQIAGSALLLACVAIAVAAYWATWTWFSGRGRPPASRDAV